MRFYFFFISFRAERRDRKDVKDKMYFSCAHYRKIMRSSDRSRKNPNFILSYAFIDFLKWTCFFPHFPPPPSNFFFFFCLLIRDASRGWIVKKSFRNYFFSLSKQKQYFFFFGIDYWCECSSFSSFSVVRDFSLGNFWACTKSNFLNFLYGGEYLILPQVIITVRVRYAIIISENKRKILLSSAPRCKNMRACIKVKWDFLLYGNLISFWEFQFSWAHKKLILIFGSEILSFEAMKILRKIIQVKF